MTMRQDRPRAKANKRVIKVRKIGWLQFGLGRNRPSNLSAIWNAEASKAAYFGSDRLVGYEAIADAIRNCWGSNCRRGVRFRVDGNPLTLLWRQYGTAAVVWQSRRDTPLSIHLLLSVQHDNGSAIAAVSKATQIDLKPYAFGNVQAGGDFQIMQISFLFRRSDWPAITALSFPPVLSNLCGMNWQINRGSSHGGYRVS
jgi:hypothetical protein